MRKVFNWLRYFWVIPTNFNGGWRFQINVPIGRRKEKNSENIRRVIK